MLTQEQIEDFKEKLERASNPVYFFDNDVDGLAAFLIIRKFFGRGKGVAIKSYPSLNKQYIRKLDEFQPDLIVVLDKPLISQDFIEAAKERGINIVWLDHHPIPPNTRQSIISYYNPLDNQYRDNHPTAYWAYKIVNNRGYEWIAMLGCIRDWFVPEFAEGFSKEFPDLFQYTQNSAKALYETPIGRITRILDFALKDKTSAIVKMIKIMLEVNNPNQISEENKKLYPIYKRYFQINKKYSMLMKRAEEIASRSSKLLFFQYGGDLSLSSELANELFYKFSEKIVVVTYIKGTKVNCSLRGLINVRDLAQKALQGIESSCGGHENAVGATFQLQDLKIFKRNLFRLLNRFESKPVVINKT